MTTNIWKDFKFTDYINVSKNEIDNLPKGVGVSTMCSSCKMGNKIKDSSELSNAKLNIQNLEKFLPLNSDDILSVKVNTGKFRSLINEKIKKKRTKTDVKEKKENVDHFYNQITVVIRVTDGPTKELESEPKINVKLFKNGSIQMSGCKSIKNINIVLNKLIYRLKQTKAKVEDDKIKEIKFIEDTNNITIYDFKIDMINSNYRLNLQIDREKLYNLLLKKKIKSSYEPCIRACVIIKYTPESENPEGKEISIFVFQKGNIIITGARTKSQILASYNYINKIILDHSSEIYKMDEKEEEDLILGLYESIMKEVSAGLVVLS